MPGNATLTATSRCVNASLARNTVDVAPRPISRTSSYLPIFSIAPSAAVGLSAAGAGDCRQDLLRRRAANVLARGQRAGDAEDCEDVVADQR